MKDIYQALQEMEAELTAKDKADNPAYTEFWNKRRIKGSFDQITS